MSKQQVKWAGLTVVIFLLLSIITVSLYAQSYSNPLNIPPALSGNFGELRNNHFHSGIDYKTQKEVNKPVFAVADGYISRINVSPNGYGLALYINHPETGHTSVYAHLNAFSDKIADYVKQQQYLKESYQVELYPSKDEFPVKKGERIGLSGNTGSSSGPHLHFEIRDTETQDPLDPLLFVKSTISDNRKPEIRAIAFYPIANKGIINGAQKSLHISIPKNKSGVTLPIKQTIRAWGRIGIGVKAYDRMDGQNNIYGIKHIRLYMDDKLIFGSTISRLSFSQTRMLNSFIDFADWRLKNSFFMKSFVEPGNILPYYQTQNQGYIDIYEEKEYKFRYELEDLFGNIQSYDFTVKGEKQNITEENSCNNFMLWHIDNSYSDFDVSLNIPAGNLYDNFCYKHQKQKTSKYLSDIHRINDKPIPLHNSASLWIKLNNTEQNSQQIGIVEISDNDKIKWIGGAPKSGGIEVDIRELGKRYAIDIDSISPTITPIDSANWVKKRQIRIRIEDDKSGVSHFRGTINNEFVLFSHDMKSSIYTFVFDDNRPRKGETQDFVFTATDAAGNETRYQYSFKY